jgi:hypothetical protein
LILFGAFLVVAWRTGRRLRRRGSTGPEAALALCLGLFALANAMVSGDIPHNEGIWIWGAFLGALDVASSGSRQPDR